MSTKSIRKKMVLYNIIAVALYFIAVAWNFKVGGGYELELGIGALILGVIKIWQEFLS